MNELLCRRRIVLFICLTALIAVLSVSLTGCRGKKTESTYGPGNEWIDDMRDRVKDEIDDPEKVAGLMAVIDKMELTLIDMDGMVKDYYTTVAKLDRDYNTTREEFQSAIDQFNTTRRGYLEKMLGCLFEMKEIAGREDWKKMSDIDKTLYEKWQRSYGS